MVLTFSAVLGTIGGWRGHQLGPRTGGGRLGQSDPMSQGQRENVMRDYLKFYINGAWVDPITPKTLDVINPATEGVAGHISLGSAADVDLAVKAARTAFESFSRTSRAARGELLERIVEEYKK
eukprot:gene14891-18843_t